MKTVGIIGGIGPESTVDYYRLIIAAYCEQRPDRSNPSIIINSIDLDKLREMFEGNQQPAIVAYLTAELQRLAAAKADFAVISANTPHLVFDELRKQSPLPLISIVEATCDAVKAEGLTKLGLLGTRFTMQGRFYPDVFSREGIRLVAPDPDEQDYIHEKYFEELVKGVFLPETRQRLLAIIDRMKERDDIGGVILAGTELPLILRGAQRPGVAFLDTTQIHVQAIVRELLA
ncbi:Aspartate racemase [Candidatus Sulfotelmatobacter sp. SbA7]|jgi:aspartate racemase|nr:Aspartate racemase [Candidatus Sulfotelmatobacter sp. SbA7]